MKAIRDIVIGKDYLITDGESKGKQGMARRAWETGFGQGYVVMLVDGGEVQKRIGDVEPAEVDPEVTEDTQLAEGA